MTFAEMKIAGVLAWALIWSVIAVSFASSASSWILVIGSGVLPALMMLRWRPPIAPAVPVAVREAHR